LTDSMQTTVYGALIMALARKLIAAFAILTCLPSACFATDTVGSCNTSCTFNIQIAHARSYVISVTWTGSGGSSGTPVVSGTDKNVSYAMGPGHYTIHAKYLDQDGTARDPAALQCGTQVKYSFTGHGQNCAAYNEAFVLITKS
jgi:hypothetical protein